MLTPSSSLTMVNDRLIWPPAAAAGDKNGPRKCGLEQRHHEGPRRVSRAARSLSAVTAISRPCRSCWEDFHQANTLGAVNVPHGASGTNITAGRSLWRD